MMKKTKKKRKEGHETSWSCYKLSFTSLKKNFISLFSAELVFVVIVLAILFSSTAIMASLKPVETLSSNSAKLMRFFSSATAGGQIDLAAMEDKETLDEFEVFKKNLIRILAYTLIIWIFVFMLILSGFSFLTYFIWSKLSKQRIKWLGFKRFLLIDLIFIAVLLLLTVIFFAFVKLRIIAFLLALVIFIQLYLIMIIKLGFDSKKTIFQNILLGFRSFTKIHYFIIPFLLSLLTYLIVLQVVRIIQLITQTTNLDLLLVLVTIVTLAFLAWFLNYIYIIIKSIRSNSFKW